MSERRRRPSLRLKPVPEKEHRPRKELFEEWRQTNAEFGFDDKALNRLIRPTTTDYAKHIRTILATALENCKLRLSHFTAHDFMREDYSTSLLSLGFHWRDSKAHFKSSFANRQKLFPFQRPMAPVDSWRQVSWSRNTKCSSSLRSCRSVQAYR